MSTGQSMISIRPAKPEDQAAIWSIIQPVIATGETYAFAPASGRQEMLAYWCGEDKHTYVAVDDGQEVVGTFFLKDNQPGLGAHIANASYMVAPQHFGRGIGRTMGEFSLAEAKKRGYRALQFNLVVKTNTRALRLWQQLGFEIIGEIPEAFHYRREKWVNAYILYRSL